MQARTPQVRQLSAWIDDIEAQRDIGPKVAESRQTELLRILRNTPIELAENKDLYKEFMETFFYIRPKGRGKELLKINNSQQVLLDAYFILKDLTPYIRMNILKGRQQGMSTEIGGFACMEMLIHPSTGALIATEEKDGSGKNLYRMYELYLQEFQELMQDHLPEDEWLWDGDITERFSFGSECYLSNDSMFTVVGEKAVTSKTLQFIHLSEAALYHHLDDCMGFMLQTLPTEEDTVSSMFIETTAKMYGNDHHEGWIAACNDRSAFKPLFLPWYIHEKYRHKIADHEREDFEKSLGDSDDAPYGNERAIFDLDNSNASWRRMWPGMDFAKYGYDNITLENLKFRRYTIREMKFNINEFNRQYPTVPEDAFLSNTAHVLDMNAIRWFVSNRQREPKMLGYLRKVGHANATFITGRGGIIAVWEGPVPYRGYIVGVDVAEGFDIGNYSCAYVICRHPFKVVARLRGSEGRSIRLDELKQQLALLGYWYNTATICVENNSTGMAVSEGLIDIGYPNQIAEDVITFGNSGRFGWRNTQGNSGTRDRGVNLLQEVITDRVIDIPCERFFDESFHFHFVNGRPQAARKGQQGGSNVGKDDDCMFAMVGALLANSALGRPVTEQEARQTELNEIQRREEQAAFRRSQEYTDHKRFV